CHELDGVLGEALELVGQPLAGHVHVSGHRRVCLPDTYPDQTIPDVHAIAVDPHTVSFTDLRRDQPPDPIDQPNTVFDQDQRAEVRIAAADGAGRVDHSRDALLHESLGGDAIQVLVVDHRDLAGLGAPQEVLGATVDPGGPGQVAAGAGSPSR